MTVQNLNNSDSALSKEIFLSRLLIVALVLESNGEEKTTLILGRGGAVWGWGWGI